MKLPAIDSLRIAGKTYKVIWESNDNLDGGNYGVHYLASQRVVVSTEPHVQQIKETMLHEVLHAWDRVGRMGLSDSQVATIACGLLQVLWDNPQLAKWLIKEDG